MRLPVVTLLTLFLISPGCRQGGRVAAAPTPQNESSLLGTTLAGSGTLPVAKGDQADIRAANPEFYAFTHPPAAPITVRPVAEYEPVQALLMQFPESFLSDRGKLLMTDITQAAIGAAQVWIVTDSGSQGLVEEALAMAGVTADEMANVKILEANVDYSYVGDFAPIPLLDMATGTMAFADHEYVPPRAYDDALTTVLARRLPELGLPPATVYRMPVVAKAGYLKATTDGTCFTTNTHLDHINGCGLPECDPYLGIMPISELQEHPAAVQLAQVWGDYLGCKKLVVLRANETSFGAPASFFAVVNDSTVVVGEYADASSPESAAMNDNAAYLESVSNASGVPFTVVRMPMPGSKPSPWTGGQDAEYSYLDGLALNGLHLWPTTTYPDWAESQDAAESVWATVMPNHIHVPIDLTDGSWNAYGVGTLATTIPALPTEAWVADGTCVDGECLAPAGGYDGACQPGPASTESCWGPAWLANPGECLPDCGGKECGPDGCGGVCGECAASETCGFSGQCSTCDHECELFEPGGCDGSITWNCGFTRGGCRVRISGKDCNDDGLLCEEGSCREPSSVAPELAPDQGPELGPEAAPEILEAEADIQSTPDAEPNAGTGPTVGAQESSCSGAPPGSSVLVVLVLCLMLGRRRE